MSERSKEIRAFADKYTIFIILFMMVVVLMIASPKFFTVTNMINLLTSESVRGILAFAVCFCICSGGIDLSLGSVAALSGVVAASFAQVSTYSGKFYPNLPELPIIVPFFAALFVGVLCGMGSGMTIAYLKIPPFIATLGMMTIARGVAFLYTDAYPVPQFRLEFKALAQTKLFSGLPSIILWFALVAVIAWFILKYTRFGKNIYSIGGNKNAARVAGVNIEKNLVGIYVWSGICAGLAGMLMAARSGSAISSMAMGYELDGIAAATVGGVSHTGGVGSVGGILAGILVLGVINNGLLVLGVNPYVQQIVKGAIIIVAVTIDLAKHNRR